MTVVLGLVRAYNLGRGEGSWGRVVIDAAAADARAGGAAPAPAAR
jgi:hypothetical protein